MFYGVTDCCVGPTDEFDELGCLSLSLNAPITALGNSVLLPVMVHVHGGRNAAGSSSKLRPTDGLALVRYSLREGKPVIVASIAYRLNWFGFLASDVSLTLCMRPWRLPFDAQPDPNHRTCVNIILLAERSHATTASVMRGMHFFGLKNTLGRSVVIRIKSRRLVSPASYDKILF